VNSNLYTILHQIEFPKLVVSILTTSKTFLHMDFNGADKMLYIFKKFLSGKCTYH
jgi:hypothetical protein